MPLRMTPLWHQFLKRCSVNLTHCVLVLESAFGIMPRPGFGGKPYRGKGGGGNRGSKFHKGGQRQGGRRPEFRQAPSRNLPLAGLGCEGVAVGGELPPLPPAAIRLSAAGSAEEAAQLGLDAFLVPETECAPWKGTIKTTEYDFHVREVARSDSNPDGEPVRLTRLAMTDDGGLGDDANRKDWRAFTWDNFEDKEARDAAIEELKGLLAPGGTDAIVEFLKQDQKARSARVSAILVCDKEGRRRVHQIFKDHIPCLDSFTETKPRAEAGAPTAVYPAAALDDKGNVRMLTLKTRTKSLNRTRRWPKEQPPYLRFVMHKQGDDSSTAIARIARVTHRTTKQFSLAGTKDRWAVTVQHVTAHHLWPDELARVNETLDSIRVGDCEFVDDQLSLGAHWGNEFGIVVRAVEAVGSSAEGEATAEAVGALAAVPNVAAAPPGLSAAAVDTAATVASSLEKWEASEYRFVNYFGAQRFGTMAVRTHEVGVAILHGDFAAACCLVLGFRPEEAAEHVAKYVSGSPEASSAAAPATDAAGSAASALDGLFTGSSASQAAAAPSSSSSSHAAAAGDSGPPRLVSGREEQARGLLDLFRMRILHPQTAGLAGRVLERHWTPYNELAVLTALMEKHRNNVVMGIVGIARNARLMYLHAAQSWLWNHAASERVRRHGMRPVAGDLVLLPEPGKDGASAVSASSSSSWQMASVRVLAQADIDSGSVTIDEVVMPLPGTRNEYPRHDCGVSLYRSLLAKQGLVDSRLDALAEAYAGKAAQDAASAPCPDQGLWSAKESPMGHVSLGDMSGGYRALVTKARAASWTIDWYDRGAGKAVPPAIKTDVDLLTATTPSASSSAAAAAAASPSAELGEPWPCVVLRFRLGQGVYATMAMREAMKGDPTVAVPEDAARGRPWESGPDWKRSRDEEPSTPTEADDDEAASKRDRPARV